MAATRLRLYQDAARLLGEARFALITDDVETRYVLDDAFDEAVSFVLRQAPWRFALKTVELAGGASVLLGYAHHYDYPGDWLRTHAIFVFGTAARPECPIDLRERGRGFEANPAAVLLRYVGSAYADPEFAGNPWPEHFAQCVGAYLAFLVAERVTGEAAAAGRMSQLFASLLPEARGIDAEPEYRWMPFQRSGEMLAGARDLLNRADWRFGLVDLLVSVQSGTPAQGFAHAFAQPPGWLRTCKLFLAGGRRENPFDAREAGGFWSANMTSFSARYVSTAVLGDSTKWPEPFFTALLAYLDAGMPEAEPPRQDGQPMPQWQQAFALARDALADPPDLWLPHQLSGRFQRVAGTMIDEGFWRFALATVPVKTVAGGFGGYSRQAALPEDWSRTRQLYRRTADGRRMPFDVRERVDVWLTDAEDFWAEYVSTLYAMDSTRWPDHYMRAVLRAVQFDAAAAAGGGQQEQIDSAASKDALAATLDSEAEPPDPWLGYQLSGAFDRARHAVIDSGYWRWALKEQQYTAETDQIDVAADSELPYSVARPADWFRTHSIFVPLDGQAHPINCRESGTVWSTDAPNFVARYLSTDALDATTWPEIVAKAALAWLDWQAAAPEKAKPLALEYESLLGVAMAAHSRPEDDWLRFQFSGEFEAARKQVIERARWRFAVKTIVLSANTDPLPDQEADGAASDGYSFRFILPNDWMRTLDVYFAFPAGMQSWPLGLGPIHDPIDYREEQEALHANRSPVTLRYISRLGLDSTRWTAAFRDAVLSWLLYTEARTDPRMAAQATAALAIFKDRCRDAERLDDARDLPRRPYAGRLAQARYSRRFGPSYGGGGGDNSSIATGPAPDSGATGGGASGSGETILTNEQGDALTAG